MAEEKLAKRKDQMRTLDNQSADCRAKARQEMLTALEAGSTRSRLAVIWDTSFGHVSRMIAQAKEER